MAKIDVSGNRWKTSFFYLVYKKYGLIYSKKQTEFYQKTCWIAEGIRENCFNWQIEQIDPTQKNYQNNAYSDKNSNKGSMKNLRKFFNKEI